MKAVLTEYMRERVYQEVSKDYVPNIMKGITGVYRMSKEAAQAVEDCMNGAVLYSLDLAEAELQERKKRTYRDRG